MRRAVGLLDPLEPLLQRGRYAHARARGVEGVQLQVGEGARDHPAQLVVADVEVAEPSHFSHDRGQQTLERIPVQAQPAKLLHFPEIPRNLPGERVPAQVECDQGVQLG